MPSLTLLLPAILLAFPATHAPKYTGPDGNLRPSLRW